MSPEQCKGDGIDRRSDVYALGVVLYELATTTRLFKGDNEYLLMDAIVNGKIPPPKSRRGDLPVELAMIIMRAVATEAEKRYQTAEELRIALEQFAIKAGLTATTSALATYMHKLFGARPEPWLETKDSTTVDSRPMGDASGSKPGSHSGQVHHSWTEIPRDGILEAEAEAQEAKTTTDGKRRAPSRPIPIVTPAAFEDTNVPQISARETRTSNKFGFEQQEKSAVSGVRPPAPPSHTFAKAVMIGLPMIAVAGVATWHFALRDNGTSTTTTTPPPAPVAAASIAPTAVPTAPAAPSKVEVALDADTANARVVFRRRVSPAPFKTELSPSDIVELVEVSAPGFKTERYWLTFDRETHLKAHLIKGAGIEEATEEQTLVALGEAADAAPAAAAATTAAVAKPAAPGAPPPTVVAVAATKPAATAAPRRKVGVKAAEEAPAVAAADSKPAQTEQAAATMTAPLPSSPPEPTPAPAPIAKPTPAPVPAVAKPAAEPARAVPPATFKTMLVSSSQIAVPDVTLTQMARDEKKKLAAVIKVCTDPSGNVTTTAVIRSSGYSEYDAKLVEGIRGWKYKGYVDGGKQVPACSAVAISFSR
jgi:outer membrane biosynthesis protein TonB